MCWAADKLVPPGRVRLPPAKPRATAMRELKVIITYDADDAEWRCNFEQGREVTAYYTNDYQDALGTAAHMAAGGQVVDCTPAGASARPPAMSRPKRKLLFYGIMLGFFGFVGILGSLHEQPKTTTTEAVETPKVEPPTAVTEQPAVEPPPKGEPGSPC
jgi:hypothetical protein